MFKDKSTKPSESTVSAATQPATAVAATPPATQATPPPKPKRTPEEKAARWRELANVRFAKLIKIFGQLENISNRANYVYTDEQQSKLLLEVDALHEHFRASYLKTNSKVQRKLLF